MALLYSDNSRKLLLKKSALWDDKILIFKTIKHLLHKKYLRTSNLIKDYLYFDKITPEYILDKLYKYNSKKFIVNPKKNKSFLSAIYIRKVYKLLGAKVLYLDLYENNLYYSLFNNASARFDINNMIMLRWKYTSSEKIKEKFDNPDVIIVNIDDFKKIYPDYYKVPSDSPYNNILKLNDTCKINNMEYEQDSVLLGNWNKNDKVAGHSIAGIKCKGEKFVYNGWTRSTLDNHINDLKIVNDDIQNDNLWIIKVVNKKIVYINSKTNNVSSYLPKDGKLIANNIEIPCELMNYEWNIRKNNDFCLNLSKCALDLHGDNSIEGKKDKNLCFSFNKGERQIIYINKNSKVDISKSNKALCENGKILNPSSNRCINIEVLNKIPKNPTKNVMGKKCPEGKILNPKTGRCINIKIPKNPSKNVIGKKCPEGKILNPKTGRCINIKIPKNPTKNVMGKNCPEGKILNPKTGRCINIKIPKNPSKNVIGKNCPEGKILNPKTGRCIKEK
jgi:hypothetical protein